MRTVNVLVRLSLWLVLVAALLFASTVMESAWPLWITLALVILATDLVQTLVRRGRAATRSASAPSGPLGRTVFGRAVGGYRHEDVVPAELPPPPGVLEGRDEKVGEIRRYLTTPEARGAPPVVVISGKPGVGKSALAVTVAHLVADHYPDGQLMVRFDTDSENKVEGALAMFTRAIRRRTDPAPPQEEVVSERVRWYQDRTRNRRVLIILDNLGDIDAIRQLLPGGPRCAMVVTARQPAPEGELPGHLPVPLEPLDPAWSTRLLVAMVGEKRIRSDSGHAERVIQATAGYLVGIQIVAAALAARRRWSLVAAAKRAEQVAGERGEVDVVDVPFVGALDLAYALLTDQERSALVLLALLETRRVEPWMLAALYRGAHPGTGITGMTSEIAGRLLDRLASARFTERRVDDGSGILAFRVPVYVRAYANAHADVRLTADQQTAARQAYDEHKRARRGNREPLRPVYRYLNEGQLSDALDAARQALALARTPDVDPLGSTIDEALVLAASAEVYAELGWVEDGMTQAEEAIKLGKSGMARVRALRVLASLQRRHRLVAEAERNLSEALRLIERVDDVPEHIRVLYELAMIHALSADPHPGLAVVDEALDLCRHAGDSGVRRLPAVLLAYGSVLAACGEHKEAEGGEHQEAEVRLRDAELAIGQEGGPQLWRPWIRLQRATVALHRGDPERSRELGVSALEGFTLLRHRYGMAQARLAIGRSHLVEGDIGRAEQNLEEAHSTFGACGDRWAEADAAVTLAEACRQKEEAQRAAALAAAAEQAFAKLGDGESQRRASKLLWDIEWSLPPEYGAGQSAV